MDRTLTAAFVDVVKHSLGFDPTRGRSSSSSAATDASFSRHRLVPRAHSIAAGFASLITGELSPHEGRLRDIVPRTV